jgi:hypothetical protein
MVFLLVSFLLAFPPISYMHSFSPPFVLHGMPISSVLRNHYAEKNETHFIPLHRFPNPIRFRLTSWIIPMVTAVLTSALQSWVNNV